MRLKFGHVKFHAIHIGEDYRGRQVIKHAFDFKNAALKFQRLVRKWLEICAKVRKKHTSDIYDVPTIQI